MWKISCFYEKEHDFANFGGCAAILNQELSTLSLPFPLMNPRSALVVGLHVIPLELYYLSVSVSWELAPIFL